MIINIQKNEFGVPITLDDQPDLKFIPDFYQKHLGNFWIALHDNRVVGTIALLDIGNNQGALRKMFVKSEFRGKEYGVGQKLLATLSEWARVNTFKHIFLGTTEKFLAAQRFYEKNGFKEVSKEQLPPSFPIMQVDVRFYEYTIVK